MPLSHPTCRDCGYEPKPSRTAAFAAYDLRQHSCRRQQLLAQRRARSYKVASETRPSKVRPYVKRYEIAWQRGERWLVEAAPYRDMLRALAHRGHGAPFLGGQLGVNGTEIHQLQSGERRRMRQVRAAAVTALYRRLRFTAGSCPMAATCAARNGWPSVEDLEYGAVDLDPQPVDEIAVHRALSGDHVSLNVDERRQAVTVGTGRGLSAEQIGDLIGISARKVQDHRRKLGLRAVDREESVAC